MGIGGGVVLIPALVFFAGTAQHTAQCTNLVFFIPTAVTALAVHIKRKNIDFGIALPIILSGLGGAYLGSRLAVSIEGPVLRKMFGVFLLLVGLYELARGKRQVSPD